MAPIYTPTEILCLLGIGQPKNISAFYSYTTADFRLLNTEQLEWLGFKKRDAMRIYKSIRTGIYTMENCLKIAKNNAKCFQCVKSDVKAYTPHRLKIEARDLAEYTRQRPNQK